MSWYEETRNKFRPRSISLLLIGESPPDPGTDDRRFFYGDELTRFDNLFRSVALAAYGLDAASLREEPKPKVLHQLKSDGIFLIDATDTPINRLSRLDRRAALQNSVGGLSIQCLRLNPTMGIFICSKSVFEVAATSLVGAGLPLLNDGPAPFPIGNTRSQFVECWRRDIPLSWPIAYEAHRG